MPKPLIEHHLIHPDGREELVCVEGKTVSIVHRLAGKVLDESSQVYRFAPQAKEAAKTHVWEARERGFTERASDDTSSKAPQPIAPPATLIRYTVTESNGTANVFLQDGKRLRTNDILQEFESAADAEFALKRALRPTRGNVITEERLSRDEAGLSKLPLTDFDALGPYFEINEEGAKVEVRFVEPGDLHHFGANAVPVTARNATTYAPLVTALTQSKAATAHLFCEVAAAPGAEWPAALGTSELPF